MADPFAKRLRRSVSILLRGEKNPRPLVPISPLTPEEVAEVRQFFPMQKFFILGHARSGTTLLARLIRLHPRVHCNWQAHFFTRTAGLNLIAGSPEAQRWLMHRSNRWNHGQDITAATRRSAADFIMERDARRAGKTIVGDKSPSGVVHGAAVRAMHDLYPDAILIYIVRDGRDVLVSERFRNFVEEKSLSPADLRIVEGLRLDQARFIDGTHSIFTEAFIHRHAQSWADDLNEIEGEGRRLYGHRYISVRYEDLLIQPFAQMQRLWEALGAAEDPSLAEPVEAEMKNNPDEEWQEQRNESLAYLLSKGQAGNWRNWLKDRDKTLFKSIAGDMLVKWDYEKDKQW